MRAARRLVPLRLSLGAAIALAAAPAAEAQAVDPLFAGRTLTLGAANGPAAVGDFNEDGHQDLALLQEDPNGVLVALGHGDGTFAAGASVPSAGSTSIATADFDGDSHLDVATTGFASPGALTVLLGDGEGGLAFAGSMSLGGYQVYAIVPGDFDGDELQDIAMVIRNTLPSQADFYLRTYRGVGDGTFTLAASLQFAGGGGLVARDFDHDGDLDIAATAIGARIYTNDGTGHFSFGASVSMPGSGFDDIAAGDIDGDGEWDLAAINTDGAVGAMIGAGDGTFPSTFYHYLGLIDAGSMGFVLTDLNGDGRDDVSVVNRNFDSIVTLDGQADGTLVTSATLSVEGGAAGIVAADFDEDGVTDVGVPGDASMLTLLAGQASGGLLAGVGTTLADNLNEVVAADFNADGRPDLALAQDNSTTSIQLGQPDGTFAEAFAYATIADAGALITADMNVDGKPDLVTSYEFQGKVSVQLGQGDGSFAAIQYTSVPAKPQDVAAGDVDGDGNPDLVTTHKDLDLFAVLLGVGDGTFTTGPNTAQSNAKVVAAADLNADGKHDLIVSQDGPSQLKVFLSVGGGSFGAPGTLATAGTIYTVKLVDVDADGLSDVLAGTTGGLRLLRGLGGGAFLPAASITSLPSTHLAVGDLNRDAQLDVVATTSTRGTVNVSFNLGQGVLGDSAEFAAGQATRGVAVADANLDGWPDVVCVGQGSSGLLLRLIGQGGVAGAWARTSPGLAGLNGVPLLAGAGKLTAGSPVSLQLTQARPLSPVVLFAGLSATPTPFKGGTLLPLPPLFALSFASNALGEFALPFAWPAGFPSGFGLHYQYAIKDAAAVHGVALSNALKSTTP